MRDALCGNRGFRLSIFCHCEERSDVAISAAGGASIADFWKILATVPGDCHVGPLGLLAMTCVLRGCTVRMIPSAIKMRNDHCRTVHVLKTPGAVSLGGWKIGKICRKGLDKRTQIWYYGTP